MMQIVLIPLFRSFILILLDSVIITKDNYGLNPFVQVFYSNEVFITDDMDKVTMGLNPFVQVFYSNWGYDRYKAELKLES